MASGVFPKRIYLDHSIVDLAGSYGGVESPGLFSWRHMLFFPHTPSGFPGHAQVDAITSC